ncbi:MAG: acetate--CoA ligase family protein, partial [Alphaproteobacteria bacterium]
MMRRLKLWPLLDGARGRPPADVEAAALAASNISRLAVAMGNRLVELDVNPLIVGAKGQGATAVDGRATLSDSEDQP